jgi:hypothetical protein
VSAHTLPELIVAAVPAGAWIIATIVSAKALMQTPRLWRQAAKAMAAAGIASIFAVFALLNISN